jgi:hypothetical protein
VTFLAKLSAAQDVALCLVRKWWRPTICFGIGGSLVVNGIVLPLLTYTSPNLAGLAALVGAAATYAVARSFEKKWGVDAKA